MTVSYPFYKAAAEFITEGSDGKILCQYDTKNSCTGLFSKRSKSEVSCVRRSNLENKRGETDRKM